MANTPQNFYERPIRIATRLCRMIKDDYPNLTVLMYPRHVVVETRMPAVVVEHSRTKFEPQLAGNEKRFAIPSGYEVEYEYQFDLFVTGFRAFRNIGRLAADIQTLDGKYNRRADNPSDAASGTTKYWTAASGITFDATKSSAQRVMRLTGIVATSL